MALGHLRGYFLKRKYLRTASTDVLWLNESHLPGMRKHLSGEMKLCGEGRWKSLTLREGGTAFISRYLDLIFQNQA